MTKQAVKYSTIWTNQVIKTLLNAAFDWGFDDYSIKFEVKFPTLGAHFLFKTESNSSIITLPHEVSP